MSYFRSLLEAAMGNEEMPPNLDAYEGPSMNYLVLPSNPSAFQDGEHDLNPPSSYPEHLSHARHRDYNQEDDDASDDAYVPHSSDEEHGDEDEEEEDSDIERQLWGKSRKRRRRGRQGRRGKTKRVTASKVPPELAGVLGEANMLYASHQYDEAILLLKDFIKKAPTIPDPYHTLGMIYEDRQDRTKALQFFLIACTLTPHDAELWKRVGRIAKDEKNFDQALFCFKKASTADPKDKDALFSYAELCREQGDNRRAAEVFKKLTVLIPKDLSLWIQIAEAYHCNEQEDEAVDALKMCIEKASMDPSRVYASKYELNAVNMLADLYITLKKYKEAIQVIHELHARYASASASASSTPVSGSPNGAIDASDPTSQVEGDPGGLPLDIAVKYGICHLFERDFKTADAMFNHLFAQDVEVFGDLYLDVADAYIALGDQDERAAAILKQLIGREEFPLEQIWIKFADCHDRMGHYDIAVEYYEKAITYQLQMDHLTVDPALVLRGMQATRKQNDPQRGIKMLETSLPEIMHAPIRPYWAHAAKRRKMGTVGDDGATCSEHADPTQCTSQCKAKKTPRNVHDDEEDEDDDEDSEYVVSGEENDEDEDNPDEAAARRAAARRHSMHPKNDPSLSVDAMENGIRLKLLIEWGHLKKMDGEAEILCQVGIPIILTSLNQTSHRLSGRIKNYNPTLHPPSAVSAEEDDAMTLGEAQSVGFQVLKSEYLVDITDPTQRESFMGIVMRVAQQVVICRALGEQEYYNLVIDVAQTLTELGKYVAAIELLTDVNTSDKISQPALRFELRFLALVIALEFKENRMAYECARLNIMEDPKHLGYWNLFARVIAITGVFSWHQKFLAKLLRDDPTSFPAIVLAGHQSSTWDIASLTVGELTLAHQKQPDDPLILFCIGLAFLSASMQRTINDRQHTVAKAFAFLQQYQHVRTKQEEDETGTPTPYVQVECWYNIGRAHQQLGLFHLAIPMYERVLRFFEHKQQIPEAYLLCRETAYNLSLIYKQSGADDLARYLITTYLTLE